MNTSEVRKMLNDKGEDGEYKIPFLVVCDAFQSEMTAFADLVLPDTTLPRAPRLHVDARPADLRVRRAGGFGAHPGAAADGRVQAVPGGAGRAGLAAEVPGLRHARRHAQVPRLPGLHRQLRDRARLRHRLPGRLARQGRREVDARRAQPEPVGDVRQEQLRLPPPHAARTPVHAQLEPGLHGLGAERRAAARQRPDRDPHLLGVPAGLPARGAGQAPGQAAARRTCASASRPTSTRCPSTTRRSRSRPPTARATR